MELLRPHCKRIAIAGSIRREKEFVGDIEIVAVPKREEFEVVMKTKTKIEMHPCQEFKDIVNSMEKVKGEPFGKYTQRITTEGIKLDLFMTTMESWGLIFMIRTGSAGFSKWMMGSVVRSKGYRVKDGYLWKGSAQIPVLEEERLFSLMGINYIEPRDREREL